MKSLQLSQIWIYPIKSLGGIPLDTARVFPKGLEHDRRWMLTDEAGMFMTQRAHPKMALFRVEINETHLIVTFSGSSLAIPLNESKKEVVHAKVWNDAITAFEVNEHCNEWFSSMLGLKARLLTFPESNPRPVDAKYSVSNDHVSLADGYPYLIIGQGSLDDLNARLKQPLPISRFRPNFVFTGGEPYEEDSWRNFKIGPNRFVGVKPCARCTVPTINQETAERGAEPLKTLATYRKSNNEVYFGQNVIAVDYTTVSVGDFIVCE